MPLLMPSAMRFYKVCALLGTLIILLDIGVSWIRIDAFEGSVTEVFESIVRTQMEIDGLQEEKIHIDTVLTKAETSPTEVNVDGIDYSAYEIERLKNELSSIQLFMQEKQIDIVTLNKQKKHVMNEVRILFLVSLLFLIMGTLLSAFGYLAWYFKVELFEDRRKKDRS